MITIYTLLQTFQSFGSQQQAAQAPGKLSQLPTNQRLTQVETNNVFQGIGDTPKTELQRFLNILRRSDHWRE